MTDEIYDLLNETTAAFLLATESCTDKKVVDALVTIAYRLRNYAVGIRIRVVVIPNASVAPCKQEIEEAREAAKRSTSSAGGHATAAVEGFQALEVLDRATGNFRKLASLAMELNTIRDES